jgi:hypothetical protein
VYCDEGVGETVTDIDVQNKLVLEQCEIEFGGVTDNAVNLMGYTDILWMSIMRGKIK